MRPLEHTDADARVILKELEAHLVQVGKSLAHHRDEGSAFYPWQHTETLQGRSSLETTQGQLETALRAVYPDLEVTESRERRKGYRVYYVETLVFKLQVTKGSHETPVTIAAQSYSPRCTVPSYQSLRAGMVRHLAKLVLDLERQLQDIRRAVTRHFENPSNGSEDTVRRGPVTHWLRSQERQIYDRETRGYTVKTVQNLACRSRGYSVVKSSDLAAVTCSKCLKHAPRK
jgi:hypothetical protein